MKVYVAGPITFDPEYESKFAAAAIRLRKAGHTVVNPVELDEEEATTLGWTEYMRRDLKHLLECDAIYLLPGWSESRGARLEECVARNLGMAVIQ
jgi:nucleoside 2-deoxyribosyltransferase